MIHKILTCLSFVTGLFLPFSLLASGDVNVSRAPTRQFTLGDMEVIAVQDLAMTMELSLFSGPASAETRKKYMPAGSAEASVNVFVIRNAGKILLVDAGYGFMNPESGMMTGLSALGIKPEMVDQVLITHMHPDHIAGLVTENGKRIFPKAGLFISDGEYDFWIRGKEDAESLPGSVVKAYGKDIKIFSPGEEVAPKIFAIAAPGHTPGHTVFLARSDRSLLFAGDILHAAALQLALPDECAQYDQNPDMAVQTRKSVLFLAAANGVPIAGAHFPFPGIGRVESVEEDGSFLFHEGLLKSGD